MYSTVHSYCEFNTIYFLLQVVLAEIYSREYPNIFCASMHPGWVDTDGMKESMPEFYNQMKDRFRTPKQGADTVVWLALAERPINNTSGLFYQGTNFFFIVLNIGYIKTFIILQIFIFFTIIILYNYFCFSVM